MKLVNMKLDPKAREESATKAPAGDRPLYPWGLEVRLDEEALTQLGLSELPKVGGRLALEARVDVTSVSDRETVDGGKKHRQRDVSLQITDLGIGAAPAEKDGETVLYGASKTEA